MVKTLGRAEAKQFSREIEDALQPLFGERGLDVEMGRATFWTQGHKIEVKVSVSVPEKMKEILDREMSWHGLDGWKTGDVFELFGEKYRLDGYNARARKYPVKITRLSDGSSRKAQSSYLERAVKVESNDQPMDE